MELLALFIFGVLATSVPTILTSPIEPILSQSQEAGDLGQYSYSYESELEKKIESRGHDGSTRGMYSYIDDNGKVQVVKYTAGVDGFHAEVQSLPVEGARDIPRISHPVHSHIPSHPHSLSGIIDDTPEVVAARRQHAAAHAAALAVLPKIPQEAAPISIHRGFHTGPVISHVDHTTGGVLGDTPEVLAAKRQHAAAHAAVRKVLPVGSHEPIVHHGSTIFPAHHVGHNNGIVQFAEEIPRSELGETPEVAAAREAHLAAYERARASLPNSERSNRRLFPF